jgi:DNA-directed RNA polymerase specialized sigma24 family protein
MSLPLCQEGQRIVFLKSRIDELTYKEIAARLEISVKAWQKSKNDSAYKILGYGA